VRLASGFELEARADAADVALGSPLTLGIRPERLTASAGPGEGTLPGQVLVAEHLGDVVYLYVQTPSCPETLTIKADPANPLAAGHTAHLGFPSHHCLIFGSGGKALPRT
jgi:multiple sugar transport system ATP-binding protein